MTIALLAGPYFADILFPLPSSDPSYPNGSLAVITVPDDIPPSSPGVTRFAVVGGTYRYAPATEDERLNGFTEIGGYHPGGFPHFIDLFDPSDVDTKPYGFDYRLACYAMPWILPFPPPQALYSFSMAPRPIMPRYRILEREIPAGTKIRYTAGYFSPDSSTRIITSFWLMVFDYGSGDLVTPSANDIPVIVPPNLSYFTPSELLDHAAPSTASGYERGGMGGGGGFVGPWADNGGLLNLPMDLDPPDGPVPAMASGDYVQLIWTAAAAAAGAPYSQPFGGGVDYVEGMTISDPTYEVPVTVFDHQEGSSDVFYHEGSASALEDPHRPWIAEWSYRIGGGVGWVQWPDPGVNDLATFSGGSATPTSDNNIRAAQAFSYVFKGGDGLAACPPLSGAVSMERVSFSTVE